MRHYPFLPRRISLAFWLLAILLAVIWFAGGASRADMLGQVVVRLVAWATLVIGLLVYDRPFAAVPRAVSVFLAIAILLPLLQLIPISPGLFHALPGREMLSDAASISGQPQPWRPWTIAPGATVNAAGSLIVPMAVLLCIAGMNETERGWLPGMMLGLIAASAVVGVLQFSGASFRNPVINGSLEQVSGSFANRNHLALFLSIGCVLAPVWAFLGGRRPGLRGPVALGLLLLFVLTILATGSRAGMIVAIFGLAGGMLLARRGLRKELARYPRWVPMALIGGIVATIAIFAMISVAADRAVSIERIFATDPGQDMRARSLPVVLSMIAAYFPFGAGLGSFDPNFRIHEPFSLLGLTYFNHAHNDFLEIALDAGLPGIVLLLAALAWWGHASVRAWRARGDMRNALPRLGSTILFLIMIASVFDYPARTPMMMAVIVMAAMWLGDMAGASRKPTLPPEGEHL